MGLTEMLTDDSHSFTPEARKEILVMLNQSVRNLFNLLENLLEWAQLQKGIIHFIPQNLILKDIVSECIMLSEEAAYNKSITLINDIRNEQQVYADINMLKALIRNLIPNR